MIISQMFGTVQWGKVLLKAFLDVEAKEQHLFFFSSFIL